MVFLIVANLRNFKTSRVTINHESARVSSYDFLFIIYSIELFFSFLCRDLLNKSHLKFASFYWGAKKPFSSCVSVKTSGVEDGRL